VNLLLSFFSTFKLASRYIVGPPKSALIACLMLWLQVTNTAKDLTSGISLVSKSPILLLF
jgi:hypothetical protein